jgi:selenocysteine lyase/cysteine desulfurase
VLYVRNEILDQLKVPTPTQDAGTWLEDHTYVPYPDGRRFEVGECYMAGRLGLGAAANYALSWGIENIRNRVQFLANRLRNQLAELPKVRVRDLGVVKSGLVSFTHDDLSPEEVMRRLALEKINVKASPGRQSRYDMDARGLHSVVRASVHYYNTESELDRFIEILADME